MPMERLVTETGLERRSLFAIRSGERLPHPRNQQALGVAVGKFAREEMRAAKIELPIDDFIVCATFLSWSERLG